MNRYTVYVAETIYWKVTYVTAADEEIAANLGLELFHEGEGSEYDSEVVDVHVRQEDDA